MPEICTNYLMVNAPERGDEALHPFDALVRTKKVPLDFESARPAPQFDNPNDLLNWREENWGTRRNCGADSSSMWRSAVYQKFITANTPPLKLLQHLSEKFPTLEFHILYYLDTLKEAGEAAYKGGKQVGRDVAYGLDSVQEFSEQYEVLYDLMMKCDLATSGFED